MSYLNNLPEIGASIAGLAVTETLYVSVNGSNTNGRTWAAAYTTIQAALDAASTNANECTQILIAPHATCYNIDTAGDPIWTGNYIIANAGTRISASVWSPGAGRTIDIWLEIQVI